MRTQGMPPRTAGSRRSGTLARQDGVVNLGPTEGTQRVRTRTMRSSASQDSDGSVAEVVKIVGGEDLDQDRPAKIVKRSSSNEKDHEGMLQSSPLSTIGIGAEHLVPDDYGSEIESQASEAGLQEPDEDAVVEMDRNGFEEELQSQVQSRAVSASQRTTPALESQQVSPLKPSSKSPVKLKGRRAKLGQSSNGRILDRATPDPGEPGGILKRLPGRRRAPHPDLSTEVDLRRQLELKIAYRAVAKALKPVLLELADRTARELEADHDLHKEYPEYQDIVEELDLRLRQRLKHLEAQLREEEARLQGVHQAKQEIARGRYASALQDHQDDHLLRCKNTLMSMAQEARQEDDSDATEYEDEIVPNLYRVDTQSQTREKIGKAYDSRSRWFVETQRLWDSQRARSGLRKVQEAVDKDSLDSKPSGFAVYDGAQRAAAVSSLNLLQLVDAGEAAEENVRQLKLLSEASNPALDVLADVSFNQPSAQPEITPLKPTSGVKAQNTEPGAESASATKPLTNSYSQPSSQKKSTSRKHKAIKNAQIPLYLPDPSVPPAAGGFPPYGYYPYDMAYPYPPLPSAASPGTGSADGLEYAFEAQPLAPDGQYRGLSLAGPTPATSNGMPQAGRTRANATSMNDTAPLAEQQEALRLQHQDQEARASSAFPAPYSNTSATVPLYHPRYVDDKGLSLIKPPSPSANEQEAQGPSKPNEWPGFSSGPSTGHGRTASFDAKFAPTPAFPMLAPSALFQKQEEPQPPTFRNNNAANRGRRSASSPDAPDREASWLRGISQASPLSQASHATNLDTHRNPNPPNFSHPSQPPPPPSSLFPQANRESPAIDSKQAFRPPSASIPPSRNPFDAGFSPSRPVQGHTRPISRSSRPASPLARRPLWSSSMSQTVPSRPESKPSSPMAQVRAHWGMQAPPTKLQEASAQTSQALPSLQPQPPQPQMQLQRPGQSGHQRILPASLDPSRRQSQVGVPDLDQSYNGLPRQDRVLSHENQQPATQTQQHQPHSLYSPQNHFKITTEQRPSAFSSRHSSYQQPYPSSTSPNGTVLGLSQRQEPAQPQAQTSSQSQPSTQPQSQIQSPSQPPDQKSMQSRFPVSHLSLPDNSSAMSNTSNFINASSSSSTGAGRSTSRGRKEPRQLGQLRWQHYANIAPAPSTSAAPSTPSPAAYPLTTYNHQGVSQPHIQPQQQPQQTAYQGRPPSFTPSSMRQPPHHQRTQPQIQPQPQPHSQPQSLSHTQSQQLQAFTHNSQHPPLHSADASPAPPGPTRLSDFAQDTTDPQALSLAPRMATDHHSTQSQAADERFRDAQQIIASQREEADRRQRLKDEKWQRNVRGWGEG